VTLLIVVSGAALLLGLGFSHLVDEQAFRESIGSIFGSELRYASREIAYFPPTIVLNQLTLGSVDTSAHADRVVLRISLLPMLARVLLFDSVAVEGAVVNVVRTPGGVRLPSAPESVDPNPKGSMRLAARTLVMPDAVLFLEDRTVSPAVRWELRNSNMELELAARELTLHFTIDGEVVTGGRVVAEGEMRAGGDLEANFRLVGVSIAPARSYFASQTEVAGALSGTITTAGSHIDCELDLSDGQLMLGEIALRGPLKINGQIDRSKPSHNGVVEVDATAAELRFGDFFTKAAGTRGQVRGEVTSGADGTLTIDAWKFEMDDFQGQVRSPAL